MQTLSLVIPVLVMLALLPAPADANGDMSHTAPAQNSRVVHVSEATWTPLNPARGAASPQAATLWGDRNEAIPTGFLVRFVDGFSSPPHIHNITYRAVVINGLVHNDDPDAAMMWMPAGSFWTQPAGEPHITAAKGTPNLALVEIDRGPYLVRPVEQAFDSGERPLNLHAANLVWVPLAGQPPSAGGVRIAYLWGELADEAWRGTFLKLPAGFQGSISSGGAALHAVVVSGKLVHQGDAEQSLTPGSYFGASDGAAHRIVAGAEETVLYIRSKGAYGLRPRP